MKKITNIFTVMSLVFACIVLLNANAQAQLLVNEVEVDPPNEIDDRCQYVELRGTPDSMVSENTYFVSINSDQSNFGFLNVAVDLSGQIFGSNGTITLLNTIGGACPNRIYGSATTILNYNSPTTLGKGSEGFYVVKSDINLFAGQDVDTNDNGVIDINENLKSARGVPFLFIDGFDFIFNPKEQYKYGPGPNLVEVLLGDVPDAATRFPNNDLANNASAWYSGELEATPEEATTYVAPFSSNFPMGGMLTPGNTNVPASTSQPQDIRKPMMKGNKGYKFKSIFTIGETFQNTTGAYNPTSAGAYVPPGLLDGLGAYELNATTVRVFANHELGFNRGYDYQVSNGSGGTFTLDGARVSYFDIDKKTMQIVDSGLAYNTIYDANGNVATDNTFLANNLPGFSRFCSSQLIEANQFGSGRGLANRIYFTGEEDGGSFNPIGGAVWALDPATGNLWHVPALARGAWESVTEIDTGSTSSVAFILADDSSPFDADGDSTAEAAPLYLYVGQKSATGDFLARNGLRGGTLYVWKSNTGELTPLDFRGSGTLNGTWVEIDNSPTGTPSENGSTGFDEFGYPTQRTLWTRAETLGTFGFSRPEDVSTNPNDGSVAVLASTGVDTYAVDPNNGNGADTFGTIYTVDTNFSTSANGGATPIPSTLTIIYDGDADPQRRLRSPDNLDWADDGLIYVQEDKAETDTLGTGEILFGAGAANPNEAGVVRLNENGFVDRIANIDRSVVLDASIANPTSAVDDLVADVGGWESSGIIDVSNLFGKNPGTLFLLDVQAHGIDDQERFNASSRINDNDLVEGGQLLFAISPTTPKSDFDGDGRADLSVFRPNEGNWYINSSTNGFSAVQWGLNNDQIVPGDYDGDGITDRAVYRPTSAAGTPDFWVLNSNGGAGNLVFSGAEWGIPGDIPVVGDYDGDGKDDVAVYRPLNNTWYILNSSNGTATIKVFGSAGDIPTVGDFDGDGKADITTFNSGIWTSMLSGGGTETITNGSASDKVVSADYDGDGQTDQATYNNGVWTIWQSTTDSQVVVNFGIATDRAVPADYDGDGKADIAIYRNGDWWILNSGAGGTNSVTVTNFGLSIDKPIPNAFVR